MKVIYTSSKSKKKAPTKAQEKLLWEYQKMLAAHSKPLEKGSGGPSKAQPKTLLTPPKPVRVSSRVIESLVGTEQVVLGRKTPMTYTGDKMKGIGVMHKSNSVPVFSDEQALEIATMRRG